MNKSGWTAEARNEIAAQGHSTDCCRRACLSGYVHAACSVLLSSAGLSLLLPERDAAVTRRINKLLRELYGLVPEDDGGELLLRGDAVTAALLDLGVFCIDENGRPALRPGIPAAFLKEPCCRVNYVRGVFLGAGSLALSPGYRISLSVNSPVLAGDLLSVLSGYGLSPGHAVRAGKQVVTVSDLEGVSDLLARLGAGETVAKLQSESVMRNVRQNANRASNCELGNIQKLVDTSMRQVAAIRKIEAGEGLYALPVKLREAALIRLEYPDDSLEALAERLGISKGALRYRLKLLTERAEN